MKNTDKISKTVNSIIYNTLYILGGVAVVFYHFSNNLFIEQITDKNLAITLKMGSNGNTLLLLFVYLFVMCFIELNRNFEKISKKYLEGK